MAVVAAVGRGAVVGYVGVAGGVRVVERVERSAGRKDDGGARLDLQPNSVGWGAELKLRAELDIMREDVRALDKAEADYQRLYAELTHWRSKEVPTLMRALLVVGALAVVAFVAWQSYKRRPEAVVRSVTPPLTPDVPELIDRIVMAPLDVAVPSPLATCTAPPVITVLRPASATMAPPTPLVPLPTVTSTMPPRPAVAAPLPSSSRSAAGAPSHRNAGTAADAFAPKPPYSGRQRCSSHAAAKRARVPDGGALS